MIHVDEKAAFRSLLCTVALLAALPTEQRPDFSGSWKIESALVERLNMGGVIGGGNEISIKQDAFTIHITRSYARATAVFSINLNGSESQHNVPSTVRSPFESRMRSKATWIGQELSIVTTRTVADTEGKVATQTTVTSERLSIKAGLLVVQRTVSKGDTKSATEEVYRKAGSRQ